MAEQLLRSLPEAARAAAQAAGVADLLLSAAGDQPNALTDPALDRLGLETALTRWLLQVCDTHALLIAVDDAPRVDEASLALLAGLALHASERRLLVASRPTERRATAPRARWP